MPCSVKASRKRRKEFRCEIFSTASLSRNRRRPFSVAGPVLVAAIHRLRRRSQNYRGGEERGELHWWSTIAQDQSQKIIDEFMKLYPFIKTNYWRSGSVGLHNKVMIEPRAGRSSWDVVSQTAPEFIAELKVRKLIASYNSAERRSFSPDFKDKDGYWTGTYALPTGLGFNTQQAKREEVPRNYQELLSPKWKERKISVDDESYELLIGLMQAWGRNAAVEYLKKLPRSSR
jgi:Bacterial extracellular solute-binding protein